MVSAAILYGYSRHWTHSGPSAEHRVAVLAARVYGLKVAAKESTTALDTAKATQTKHDEALAAEKAKTAAEGAYFTFPNVYASQKAVDFKKRYEERFGVETGPYSVYSYVTANILFESIAKAGKTDGKAIADAIRGMEHQTAIGPISFDAKGDVTRSIYTMWVVKDGDFTRYEEPK